jgi:hypothetical protein
MTGRNNARLKRLELQEPIRDEPPGQFLEIIVETCEQARQSRELDELFCTGRAYLAPERLPPKADGESITFDEYLAAVVHVPYEQVVERAGAGVHRERLFL